MSLETNYLSMYLTAKFPASSFFFFLRSKWEIRRIEERSLLLLFFFLGGYSHLVDCLKLKVNFKCYQLSETCLKIYSMWQYLLKRKIQWVKCKPKEKVLSMVPFTNKDNECVWDAAADFVGLDRRPSLLTATR